MQIYNSLTRKKEKFTPLKGKNVNIYTCGVTVYDDCHIGHARSLYIFDVMRRYLKYRGYKVNFVRNITDIDDKIINRANELKVDWEELVKKYIASYYEDLKALAIDKGDKEPRATENIPDMIKYIKQLIDKGYAYEAGGDVYFDVRKFSDYGKLSGQAKDKMREGVRIEPGENKKDPLDFALWKSSKEGEPSWKSPWGDGRPGWHIECSVMSQKFLKTDTLDIHAGGRDLIFPHHENEIAQGQAKTGKQFANYWIHHGLLTINGHKMAKSLANFITIKDALKMYPADALKIFYLQAHYSSSIDFSDEKMNECKSALERFHILFDSADRMKKRKPDKQFAKRIEDLEKKFIEAMDDDFNTPQALAILFDMLKEANKDINQDSGDILCVSETISKLGAIFGLFLAEEKIDKELENYVESKIKERKEEKEKKDFKKADVIRKELKGKGIILEDTKEGTTWRRKL